MGTKPKSPDKIHSHYVSLLPKNFSVEREQVFLDFKTKWRGKDAVVQMCAERYQCADGTLAPWRIWASDARPPYSGVGFRPEPLTDLAKSRLGAEHKADATAFVESEVYEFLRRERIVQSIVHIAKEMRADGVYGSEKLRRAAEAWKGTLDFLGQWDDIMRIADAFDAFDKAVQDAL